MALLEVRNLKVHFPVKHGILSRSRSVVKAIDEVSLEVANGETVGLVGESGCGKSTLGRAIVKLLAPTAGQIWINGEDIAGVTGKELRRKRRHFQMIFQDPIGSLNPRMNVGQIVAEGIDIHGMAGNSAARREKIGKVLRDVGLESAHAHRYPHEFSGGQRQRIGIARALAVEPKLVVCDEPVSALDVSVQAQIINLLEDIQRERGIAYLFIAHDLAVVEHLSNRILVMYLGKIVESGPAKEVINRPRHPYTQALISAVPTLDDASGRKRLVVGGEMPSPINPPSGCPFHPRCPLVEDRCRMEAPTLRELDREHKAACHFADRL